MNQDELSIELPGRKGSRIQDVIGHSVRNATQRSPEAAKVARESRGPATVQIVPKEDIRRQNSCRLRPTDVLSRHHFLKQLQLEKRRTDRSKVPVSIALFRVDDRKRGELGEVNGLLDVLHNNKRETDILGYLGENTVALLLTDTNEQGTKGFTNKIVSRANDLAFSTITGTYPDLLFENLIKEQQDLPDSYPLFLDDSADQNEFGPFLKRPIDIVGALAAIVLFSPLMLITGIAIAATSPGPVIFKQIRFGRRGTPFVFYKFRSMYCKADDRIHREYVTSLIKGNLEEINEGDAAKPLYKMKADPRITRVGRFIRKTSIDELPQFFNVLKGEMSLVGPRPPLPYEAEKYESWHLRRILEIKPGITGLWQVEGRSKTSFDDMVRLDLRYTRSRSLMLDLKILIKTIKVVLRRTGAS